MAVPANTVRTFERVANREDLSDMIYDISPMDTPFMSNIGRGSASNVFHEWQTDELAAADADNKHLQGDDSTPEASPATTRPGNYTQIMKKVVSVSGTQDASDHAGYAKEFAYQAAKKGKELKRDMEARLTGNFARVAPAGAIEGETAGFEGWLATNTNRGAGGADADGLGTTAATDGTQRAFTEVMIKDVMQKCFENGGEPTMLMLGSKNKQNASSFTGIADQRRSTGNKAVTIIGAADVYVSDFGELNFVPNRFSRDRSALFVDPSHVKLAWYRNVKTEALARTGDSRKADMIGEFTLEMCNEKAHGAVADLTV